MKSIRRARVVVVTDSTYGLLLVARLRRMDVARVIEVPCLEDARHRCQGGEVDACIVAIDGRVPDTIPIAECDAPGRGSGVPSLLVVRAATPHLRKAARRGGYLAVVSGQISPRMLYRRIGAALQRRRAASRGPRRIRKSIGAPVPRLRSHDAGGMTLH
jgi:hypothetical protein